MTLVTHQPITGLAAWRGNEIAESDAWKYYLSDTEVRELEEVGARFVKDEGEAKEREHGALRSHCSSSSTVSKRKDGFPQDTSQ